MEAIQVYGNEFAEVSNAEFQYSFYFNTNTFAIIRFIICHSVKCFSFLLWNDCSRDLKFC